MASPFEFTYLPLHNKTITNISLSNKFQPNLYMVAKASFGRA